VQDEKGEVPGFGDYNKNMLRKNAGEPETKKCAC